MTPTATDASPTELSVVVPEIEQALADCLAGAEMPENLRAAVAYAALEGGKRLRPTLVVLGCEAVGGTRAAAMPAAIAIELVHCFSLVHDDLPAMDDDDLRRGRPTLHVRAGEAMAILAGDLMTALAFRTIAESAGPAESRVALLRELTAGTTAMIGGQVYDTLGGFPAGLDDRSRLDLTHRNKTGALIRAACRMGAIAGDASAADLAALTTYGESIGLMFQIVDDLLDVTQSTEHIGKATGKDERAGKLTFPGLIGIDGSRREVERLRDVSRSALAGLGPRARPLSDLCDFMAVRTR